MKKLLLITVCCICLCGCNNKEKSFSCKSSETLLGKPSSTKTEFKCINNNLEFPVLSTNETTYATERDAQIAYNVTEPLVDKCELNGSTLKFYIYFSKDSLLFSKCDEYIESLEKEGMECTES